MAAHEASPARRAHIVENEPLEAVGSRFDDAYVAVEVEQLIEADQRFGSVSQYVEPFGGSAGVLFGRPGRNDGYRETLNDASGLLVNMYRALRDDPDPTVRSAAATAPAATKWWARWMSRSA